MQYNDQDKTKLIDYFIYPHDIIENEMNELMRAFDPCFIVLGLLVIFNNNIDKQSLTLYDQKSTTEVRITTVLNDMLHDIDYGYLISMEGISDSLSHLRNIYTKETPLTYTCFNKSMFDMLVEAVGRHFIPSILKHGNSGFIKKKYVEVPFSTNGKRHTIKIESKYEEMYFKRIIEDLNKGFYREVFEIFQMEHREYRMFFVSKFLEMEKPTLRQSSRTVEQCCTLHHSVDTMNFHAFCSK
ncbi:unnamed protein product [Mytilus edulis]|uniref:Uncharacterized protein n=1 Tax=Mytilus edulis TaxID=6550 RepID=A0A8S3V6T9_MYTED|nr:unnamed protein product [Mytilus edulis]